MPGGLILVILRPCICTILNEKKRKKQKGKERISPSLLRYDFTDAAGLLETMF